MSLWKEALSVVVAVFLLCFGVWALVHGDTTRGAAFLALANTVLLQLDVAELKEGLGVPRRAPKRF